MLFMSTAPEGRPCANWSCDNVGRHPHVIVEPGHEHDGERYYLCDDCEAEAEPPIRG